jgi:hypothetical protein
MLNTGYIYMYMYSELEYSREKGEKKRGRER